MSTRLISFLVEILGDYKEYDKMEFYFECPFCNRGDGVKKLAIKLDPNGINKRGESSFTSYHCWRDASHIGNNLISLVKSLNLSNDKLSEARSILKEYKYNLKDFESIESKLETRLFNNEPIQRYVELPKEFKSFITSNKNDIEYKNALTYLSNRQITLGDIIKNNIGYCDSGKYYGYIILPSYDKNGKLNYFIGRNYYENSDRLKHKNYRGDHNIVFNELHINWTEPIIIVEGGFDNLAVKRNVIPILGKYMSSELTKSILSNGVKILYIALDADALKDAIKYIEKFINSGIKVFLVDMNNGKDPSEIGFEAFWNNLEKSKQIGFSELLKLKMECI